MASGAPKFDRLPTRIRFGSSTAPGWMYAGNNVGIGWAHAGGTGLLRNVPTCEMADAPGIFTAITRASMLVIACARAACHDASPSKTAMLVAKAIMLGKAIMRFRVVVRLRRLDARSAAVLAV